MVRVRNWIRINSSPGMTSTTSFGSALNSLNRIYLEPVPGKPPTSLFISSESDCSDAGEDATGNAKNQLERRSAKDPPTSPIISSGDNNWTAPSAIAGGDVKEEKKTCASVVIKVTYPKKVPRIKDWKRKSSNESAMKSTSTGSRPRLRPCTVRVKRLSIDDVKRLRKKYRREGRARRNEEKAERKRKFLSSSDEEDERDKKEKRPKGDEREISGYDPISKLKLKREEERKTKKESKEKKRDVGGAAHEKTKTHSGYNFNYGRSNNNAFVGKIAGMDGKPKPKNKDKVGFYSSSGSDKNKNSNGPKNNNEEGTGKLIQNPLFCGQVSPKEIPSPSSSALMPPPPPPPRISAKSQQLKTPPTSPMMLPSSDTVKDMGRIPKKGENENVLADILKLETRRPVFIEMRRPLPELKPQVQSGNKRKNVAKRTAGTQTNAFDAIVRLEKEFGTASKDLGISDKIKAMVMSSSVEFQKEFYYRVSERNRIAESFSKTLLPTPSSTPPKQPSPTVEKIEITPSPQPSKFQCLKCNEIFEKKELLMRHLAIRHYSEAISPEGSPFSRCPFSECEVHEFETRAQYVEHLAQDHAIMARYLGTVIENDFMKEIPE